MMKCRFRPFWHNTVDISRCSILSQSPSVVLKARPRLTSLLHCVENFLWALYMIRFCEPTRSANMNNGLSGTCLIWLRNVALLSQCNSEKLTGHFLELVTSAFDSPMPNVGLKSATDRQCRCAIDDYFKLLMEVSVLPEADFTLSSMLSQKEAYSP